MLIFCLLVTAVTGQLLSSPDGGCEAGWECISERNCKPYLDGKDQLEHLRKAFQLEGDEGVGEKY